MIYVDADACPVKTEIEQVATRLNVVVKMVCNGGIRPSKNPLIDLVVVDAGPDLADMWIANHAKTGDVVITTDIPLAAKVIQAGATVLKPNGERLTSINIGNALATRDLMYDLRAADPFRQSSGKGFSKNDRSRFLGSLDQVLRK